MKEVDWRFVLVAALAAATGAIVWSLCGYPKHR